jgi:ribosomal protein S27AE
MIIIDMKHVSAIRLECTKCQASVSIPPKDPWHLREQCPNCGTAWLSSNSTEYEVVESLLKTATELGVARKDAPCKIQLEVNLPES